MGEADPSGTERVKLQGCQRDLDELGVAPRSRNPVSGSCPGLCTENHAWVFTAVSDGFRLFNGDIRGGLILAFPHTPVSNLLAEVMKTASAGRGGMEEKAKKGWP